MTSAARVLVTGAGGFVGSHLAADQAQRGRQVVAVDLRLESVRHLESPEFELVKGDVGDRAVQERALDGVDTVFHLAAAHLAIGSPDSEYWRVNVEAVRSLVECAERVGVRRFVHCSSVGVHGHVQDPPANEHSPCRPDMIYEKTKLAGEQVVCEAIKQRGFPATVIRPTWVYGPGCPRTEKLFRTIKSGTFVIAGQGRALRHCVYVRDMLTAFELAASASAAVGQVMIVGDAAAVTVRRLADLVAELTGARPPISLPLTMVTAIAFGAELAFKLVGKEPPVSRRSLKFFTGNWSFDISRARRLLGYEPRYDLTSGLAETYELLSAGERRVPLPAESRMSARNH